MQTLKSISVLTMPAHLLAAYVQMNGLFVASVHKEWEGRRPVWEVLQGGTDGGGWHVATFTKRGEAVACKDRVQALIDSVNKPELATA